MANVLTAIIPKIISQFDQFFVKKVVMANLVNSSFSTNEILEKGDTITIPISQRRTIHDVAPSNTPPDGDTVSVDYKSITLDYWKQVHFKLNMKEEMEIVENPAFIPQSMTDALVSLAEYVNGELFKAYKKTNLYVGSIGTDPFGSDTTVIKSVRKLANQYNWPARDRVMILDADADANIVDLANFQNVSQAGDDNTKVEGLIGRKFGFDFYYSPEAEENPHTNGTVPTGTSVDNASAGANQINLTVPDGSSITINEGDILSIASHDTKYVCTSTVTGSGTGSDGDLTVNIYPAVSASITGDPVLTLLGGNGTTYSMNLAFHKQAVGLAVRPQRIPDMAQPGRFSPIVDPLSGLSMLLERDIQHKQTVWYLSILFGFEVIKENAMVRIHGA